MALKNMMRTSLYAVGLLVSLACATAKADPIALYDIRPQDRQRVEDGLKLEYISQDRWPAVVCEHKTIEAKLFFFCRSARMGSQSGGLFLTSYDAKGEIKVTPMNGKAMQHFKGVQYIHDINNVNMQVTPLDRANRIDLVGMVGRAVAEFN